MGERVNEVRALEEILAELSTELARAQAKVGGHARDGEMDG
jgi:hypothetical protein